jgi:hypothetical protein
VHDHVISHGSATSIYEFRDRSLSCLTSGATVVAEARCEESQHGLLSVLLLFLQQHTGKLIELPQPCGSNPRAQTWILEPRFATTPSIHALMVRASPVTFCTTKS